MRCFNLSFLESKNLLVYVQLLVARLIKQFLSLRVAHQDVKCPQLDYNNGVV